MFKPWINNRDSAYRYCMSRMSEVRGVRSVLCLEQQNAKDLDALHMWLIILSGVNTWTKAYFTKRFSLQRKIKT